MSTELLSLTLSLSLFYSLMISLLLFLSQSFTLLLSHSLTLLLSHSIFLLLSFSPSLLHSYTPTLSLTHSLTHSLVTDGRSDGKIVTVATLLLTPSATWWSQGRRGNTSRPRRRSRGRQTQWARRGSQWQHGGTECPPSTRGTEVLYRAVRRRSASHGVSQRTRCTQDQDRKAACSLAVACGRCFCRRSPA